MQVGLGLTKASLMLTVKRFARSSLVYIYFIHTMVITILIFTVASTLILTMGCRPLRAAWEDAGPEGNMKCPSLRTYLIIMFVHMATDFITLVSPMPLLLRVKLPLLQRIFLILCFTLGSMCVVSNSSPHRARLTKYSSVVASVLRLYAILKVTSHAVWDFCKLILTAPTLS